MRQKRDLFFVLLTVQQTVFWYYFDCEHDKHGRPVHPYFGQLIRKSSKSFA
jgi:hypothetical protein